MVLAAGGGVIEGVREVPHHPLMAVGGAGYQTRRQRIHDAEVGGGSGGHLERNVGQVADLRLLREVANGLPKTFRLCIDPVRILVSAGVVVGGSIRMERAADGEKDQ